MRARVLERRDGDEDDDGTGFALNGGGGEEITRTGRVLLLLVRVGGGWQTVTQNKAMDQGHGLLPISPGDRLQALVLVLVLLRM